MDEVREARFAEWLRTRGIEGPRRVVRESEDAILVSKFAPGFAARLHEALDRVPEIFNTGCIEERYRSAESGLTRVEAWRLALEGLLDELGPQRGLDREQVAEIRAGTDSVAGLLDSVLWSAPKVGDDWSPGPAELEARADALARMNDDSSIFTRYYGEFEGLRVENHCPGARVARELFEQAWAVCTGPAGRKSLFV